MDRKYGNKVCGKCNEEYNLSNRIPRLLSQCGHTLCQECIYFNIVKSNVSFQCPEDHQHFKYRENDVQQFIKNYQIIKNIQDRSRKRQNSKQSSNNSNSSSVSNNKNYSKTKSLFDQKGYEKKMTSPFASRNNHKQQNSYIRKQYSTKPNNVGSEQRDNEIENQIKQNIKNYNIENSFTLNLLENSDNEFTNEQFGSNLNRQNSQKNNENMVQLQKTQSYLQRQSLLQNQKSELKSLKCMEHNKTASQICVEHQVVLCPTCVFLGKHKDHKIMEEQQVIHEVTQQTEGMIKMLQKLEMQCNIDFRQFSNIQELTDRFVKKEQVLNRNIKQVFNNFRTMVNNLEQETLQSTKNRLELLAQQLYVIQNMNIVELEKNKNRWKQKTQEYIKEFISQTGDHQIPYKLYDNKKLHSEGVLLQNDIEKLQKIDYQGLQRQLDQLKVQFNKELMSQMVIIQPDDAKQKQLADMKLIDIIEQSKNHKNDHKLYDQNDLLNFNFENSGLLSFQSQNNTRKNSVNQELNPKREPRAISRKGNNNQDEETKSNKTSFSQLIQKYTSSTNRPKQQIQIKTMHKSKQSSSSKDVKKVRNRSVQLNKEQNSLATSCNFEGNSKLNITETDNNEKKEFNLKESISSINLSPQFRNNENHFNSRVRPNESQNYKIGEQTDHKLQKVIDELKFDQTDTIDLTCAKLGNRCIRQLKHYIEISKRLKSIKLVQNNLNDEIADILFQAIKKNDNIQHINLSLNQFTEQAVFKFMDTFRSKCSVKNIYFNQNKIKQNKVVAIKREMKKQGVHMYT